MREWRIGYQQQSILAPLRHGFHGYRHGRETWSGSWVPCIRFKTPRVIVGEGRAAFNRPCNMSLTLFAYFSCSLGITVRNCAAYFTDCPMFFHRNRIPCDAKEWMNIPPLIVKEWDIVTNTQDVEKKIKISDSCEIDIVGDAWQSNTKLFIDYSIILLSVL